MIATKTIVPERKLKIKFTSKRTEPDAAIRPCLVAPPVGLSHDCSSAKHSAPGSKKRGSVWVTEIGAQTDKRQKIERSMKAQCSAILNKLMSHRAGWIFNQPVDPVALHIPDYFSIISKPMDLGTIKSKLEKHVYSHVNEFAADVRLTFSNAMLYNPPSNEVHMVAKELNQIFEKSWKVLEEKYNSEGSKFGSEKSSCGPIKIVIDKTASLGYTAVSKRATPSKETVGRRSFQTSGAEVEHVKTAKNNIRESAKNFGKGTEYGGEQVCYSVTERQSSPTVRKCGSSCGNITCRCSRSSDTARMSSSDISTDRSLERDSHVYSAVSRMDCQAKRISASPMRKSDPDSDVSTVDNENACPSSEVVPSVSNTVSGQDETADSNARLSPQKALRAAMLKCRFADTILKAQQKSLDHGDRNDPEKLKKEKERLERRQREEKARIEAEMRAAEAASREKAAIELKQQRERDREAARVALEKMERTAEIELNLEALEELEILSGYTPSSRLLNRDNGRGLLMASSWPVYTRSMLEQLGLFIKPEYLGRKDEDEEAILGSNEEEGEIL